MKKIYFIAFILICSKPLQAKWSEGWTLGLGVEYSSGSNYIFKNGIRQSFNDQAFTANIKMASHTIPSIQLLYSKKQSFGFYLKYSRLPKIDVTGGNINYSTGSINAVGNLYISKYENSIVHIGSLYRFENFYIPFGINISLIPEFTSAIDSGTIRGLGLGQEIGIGYNLFYGFMLEVLYRSLSFSYGQQTAVGPPNEFDDFKYGTSQEVLGGLRYYF